MITFLDGEWLGSLSEMDQQSKLPLSYGKLSIQFVWLPFFPWMSCISFSQCDMLCLRHILNNLTISCRSQDPTRKLSNCFSIALYSLLLSYWCYKFGEFYSLVIVINVIPRFRKCHETDLSPMSLLKSQIYSWKRTGGRNVSLFFWPEHTSRLQVPWAYQKLLYVTYIWPFPVKPNCTWIRCYIKNIMEVRSYNWTYPFLQASVIYAEPKSSK